MKNRELEDLKKDPNITPEDVARFSLYENDMNDSSKYTAICDLVVCCERSQTLPLQEKVSKLEKENAKLREALEALYSWQGERNRIGTYRDALNKARQALNPNSKEE